MFLCMVLVLAATYAVAQEDDSAEENKGIEVDPNNLVGNFSFEEMDGKIKRFGDIEIAVGWWSPTANKADLFSKDVKKQELGVPKNIFGLCKPVDGDRIVGITMYSYNGKHPRSYLSTELLSTLQAGQTYCVKFNVSLSDYSKYAINNIGAAFTKKKIKIDKEVTVELPEFWTNTVNKIFDEQYTWQAVCNTYEATGEEQFLTIGNFASDENTETAKMRRPKGFTEPQNTLAYYFIDNVSVTPFNPDELCDCEESSEDKKVSIVYSKKHPNFASLTPKEKIEASTIYFADLKSELEDASKPDLDLIAEILAANPDFQLNAIGHSDKSEEQAATANPSYFDMAGKRVMQAKQYLVSKGANPRQITATNVKDTEPADTSETEIGQAKNRRVEFKF